MVQRVSAIFENGVFRPSVPLELSEGERVSLNVELPSQASEFSDIEDLLDFEFMASCRQVAAAVPALEEVRQVLDKFPGSLADLICEERDER